MSTLAGGCNGAAPDRATETEAEGRTGSTYVSFEEFEKTVDKIPGTDRYVIDEDQPIDDIKHLREYYEFVQTGALAVFSNGNAVAKWSDEDKYNLRYCVSPTFGARKESVVNAMAYAAAEWESFASVKFTYEYTEDAECTVSNERVLFNVQPTDSKGKASAYAFLPGYPRSSRQLLLDEKLAFSSPEWLIGVTRHELGHVLGFVHEHLRPEAKADKKEGCVESIAWTPLTAYDKNSVMHYPACNGDRASKLTLTRLDAEGVALLYGPPGKPALYNPAPTGLVSPPASDVAKDEFRVLEPVEVRPGTSFNVAMRGDGDPDLYVGFDGPPSPQAFDCRPLRTGPAEECRLTVPEGKTKAYVAVRGYTAGTYKIEAQYTAP